MENALHDFLFTRWVVSENSLAHSFVFWYHSTREIKIVRAHFPWRNLYLSFVNIGIYPFQLTLKIRRKGKLKGDISKQKNSRFICDWREKIFYLSNISSVNQGTLFLRTGDPNDFSICLFQCLDPLYIYVLSVHILEETWYKSALMNCLVP